jgi:hypothetical protein
VYRTSYEHYRLDHLASYGVLTYNNNIIIAVYVLIITGEVCSEEALESQNKSFVPQLTHSKSGNHDHLDKKVICLVVASEGFFWGGGGGGGSSHD